MPFTMVPTNIYRAQYSHLLHCSLVLVNLSVSFHRYFSSTRTTSSRKRSSIQISERISLIMKARRAMFRPVANTSGIALRSSHGNQARHENARSMSSACSSMLISVDTLEGSNHHPCAFHEFMELA